MDNNKLLALVFVNGSIAVDCYGPNFLYFWAVRTAAIAAPWHRSRDRFLKFIIHSTTMIAAKSSIFNTFQPRCDVICHRPSFHLNSVEHTQMFSTPTVCMRLMEWVCGWVHSMHCIPNDLATSSTKHWRGESVCVCVCVRWMCVLCGTGWSWMSIESKFASVEVKSRCFMFTALVCRQNDCMQKTE